jgi:hypothetical protein
MNLKTVMLKDVPSDVDDMIIKEQARLCLNGLSLKKAPVVYEMIREWYRLKTLVGQKTSEASLTT